MARLPSDESDDLSIFDRFAGWTSTQVARAPFFAACVVLVGLWACSWPLFGGDVDTWQLLVNTATTIITFLLVALLQNTTARADKSTQTKLNAVADGLSDLLVTFATQLDMPGLADDADELRQAVGLEDRMSS